MNTFVSPKRTQVTFPFNFSICSLHTEEAIPKLLALKYFVWQMFRTPVGWEQHTEKWSEKWSVPSFIHYSQRVLIFHGGVRVQCIIHYFDVFIYISKLGARTKTLGYARRWKNWSIFTGFDVPLYHEYILLWFEVDCTNLDWGLRWSYGLHCGHWIRRSPVRFPVGRIWKIKYS